MESDARASHRLYTVINMKSPYTSTLRRYYVSIACITEILALQPFADEQTQLNIGDDLSYQVCHTKYTLLPMCRRMQLLCWTRQGNEPERETSEGSKAL
jgi:hypothetical protein